MRSGTPHISSLKRTLATLDAVLIDGVGRPIADIARDLAIPPATAHRQVVTLVAEGYLARGAGGGYVAGPRLLRLLRHLDEKHAAGASSSPDNRGYGGACRTGILRNQFQYEISEGVR
jgi:DNA-binding IclR family transcriptional regulator